MDSSSSESDMNDSSQTSSSESDGICWRRWWPRKCIYYQQMHNNIIHILSTT